jgi:hypothetical protein
VFYFRQFTRVMRCCFVAIISPRLLMPYRPSTEHGRPAPGRRVPQRSDKRIKDRADVLGSIVDS